MGRVSHGVEFPRGLQVAKLQRSKHGRHFSDAVKTGLSFPLGHGRFRSRADRRSSIQRRTERPLVTPLGIAVRGSQRVVFDGIERTRSSRSTFSFMQSSRHPPRLSIRKQEQTIGVVPASDPPNCWDRLRTTRSFACYLSSSSLRNSWFESAARFLLLRVKLAPTLTDGSFTSRVCRVASHV